ncbi:MAG: hypothetical protein AABZ06_02190 [Bdellovibrionota bacterium]
MQWNCPHCGMSLAVHDDKISSGWSFSKCYKCGGFSLVKRSEANVIKVDKAPRGENVLLPESSETPLMRREALENLATFLRPAATNKMITPPPPPPMGALRSMPGPLPLVESSGSIGPVYRRFLPAAIGLASVATIASGAYMYLQGPTLSEKASYNTATALTEPQTRPRNNNQDIRDEVHHNSMAPVRPVETREEPPQKETQSFIVKVKIPNASLYSGPGNNYPMVGIAYTSIEYIVVGWNERWFHIAPVAQSLNLSNQIKARRDIRSGWIRNDILQLAAIGNR